MAEAIKPAQESPPVQKGESVTDPYNVAPVVVNDIGAAGQGHGIGNLILLTYRGLPVLGGATKVDPVVCARLRFDMNVAAQLRNALDKIILDATVKPEGTGH